MRKALVLLLPLALGACLPQNRGLESQHPPIAADGGAKVAGCPDWSTQGVDSAAGTDSNYGCATNADLAAMIANPADLDHGTKAKPGDSSDVAVRAIIAWRTASGSGASSGGGGAAPSGPKGN